jgi:hypothetical protein
LAQLIPITMSSAPITMSSMHGISMLGASRRPRRDAGREQPARRGLPQDAGSDPRQRQEQHPHHPHKPNIVDAVGKDWFDVKEGEASIFKPEGGKYRLVARVQMEDWPRLAVSAN